VDTSDAVRNFDPREEMGICATAASHQIYSGGVGCGCRGGAFDKSTDEQSRTSCGSSANRTSMLII